MQNTTNGGMNIQLYDQIHASRLLALDSDTSVARLAESAQLEQREFESELGERWDIPAGLSATLANKAAAGRILGLIAGTEEILAPVRARHRQFRKRLEAAETVVDGADLERLASIYDVHRDKSVPELVNLATRNLDVARATLLYLGGCDRYAVTEVEKATLRSCIARHVLGEDYEDYRRNRELFDVMGSFVNDLIDKYIELERRVDTRRREHAEVVDIDPRWREMYERILADARVRPGSAALG